MRTLLAQVNHYKDTNYQKKYANFVRDLSILFNFQLNKYRKQVCMNIFDLIVYLAMAWAIYNGWRRGLLLQLLSLVSVAVALYLAVSYGAELGDMLGMKRAVAPAGGFLAIFVASLIVIAVGGHLLRGLLKLAGLGLLDTLLGIVLSVVKMILIISVLFSGFAKLNKKYKFVSKQTIESSRWFEPATEVADKVLPYFGDLKDNILK